MSTTTATPDEQPKQDIAAKVITPKRHYFFPAHSKSILATSLEKAEDELKNLLGESEKPKRVRKTKATTTPTETAPEAAPEAPATPDATESVPAPAPETGAEPSADVAPTEEVSTEATPEVTT